MTLREAIEQLYNLGVKDPHEMLGELERRHGTEWLQTSLFEERDWAVAEIARQMTGHELRSSARGLRRAVRDGKPVKRDIMLVPINLGPGVWKPFGKCTRPDIAARMGMYDVIEIAARAWRGWYGSIDEMMVAQGVAMVSQLKGELPPPPEPRGELEAA